MNRVIVLVLVLVFGCGAVWYFVQQDHERTFQVEMGKALAAHATKNDAAAEQTLVALLPLTEKWWPNGFHVLETLTWLGIVYRVELKYDQAEPMLKRAVDLAGQQGSNSPSLPAEPS
jgi:hypothetical protein